MSLSETKIRATLLSVDPVIIYVGNYAGYEGAEHYKQFAYLSSLFINRPVIFLFIVAWSCEQANENLPLVIWTKKYKELNPHHRIIFLTNTVYEEVALRNLGMEAKFANHNIFVDPNVYKIIDDNDKLYDAVCNSQFRPFKRHYLAKDVKKLAVIGHGFETEYTKEILSSMSNAIFCNMNDAGLMRGLSNAEVNQINNQSSVGLCLSAVEGAMHASIEFLLAGLPIVTTVNKGGRDYFFQGDYVTWVEPDSAAVAEAVNNFKKIKIDPNYIRTSTINKINIELDKFFNFLAELSGSTDQIKLRDLWQVNYNDKLMVNKLALDIYNRTNRA